MSWIVLLRWIPLSGDNRPKQPSCQSGQCYVRSNLDNSLSRACEKKSFTLSEKKINDCLYVSQRGNWISASLPWLHTQKPVWYLGWWDVRDCAHLWPFRRSTKCEHSVRGEETLGHAPTHVDSYQTKLDVISTKPMTLSEPKVTSRDVCSALHFSNILECAQGTSCKTPQKRP